MPGIIRPSSNRMPTEPLQLTMQSSARSERLADLARDLTSDLQRQRMLQVNATTRPAAPGERAVDISLIGQIVLTFLSAGAAQALIGCLKAYIDRDRSLRFQLKRPDGTELHLEGKHFEPAAIDETLRALERFAH